MLFEHPVLYCVQCTVGIELYAVYCSVKLKVRCSQGFVEMVYVENGVVLKRGFV